MRKDMNFKSYIDYIIYKKNEENSYILLRGWAFDKEDRQINYKAMIDGKEVEPIVTRLDRGDVAAAHGGGRLYAKSGFMMEIPISSDIDPMDVKIYGHVEDSNFILQELPRKKLLKYKNSSYIEHKIDSITSQSSEDGVRFQINGWAFIDRESPNEIAYQVVDRKGDLIEIDVRKRYIDDISKTIKAKENNTDCGFIIKFKGNIGETYSFLIIGDENNLIEVKIRHKEETLLTTIIENVKAKKINKAVRYLINYGVKGFLEMVKKAPQVHSFGIPYEDWLKGHEATKEELEQQRNHSFEYAPKVSLLVPTYNTPIIFLREMIESVIEQTYPNWELCIGEGSGGNKELERVIEEYCQKDSRIKCKILDKNYGISGNTNAALSLATGDYVTLFDHDDLLTPNALYEVVKSLQDVRHDIIYTDEDKVTSDLATYFDPHFKPAWSPDLFRSHNYICHLFTVKRSIIEEVGGFRSEYDGSQDYDVMFRCIEKSESIEHIPKILYHWRIHKNSMAGNPESKMYCYEAGRKAIQSHYDRTGVPAKVEFTELMGIYHTIYETPGNPLVSIVIPNKDHPEDLKNCIESLFGINTYTNFEIIIVENNSEEQDTFTYYSTVQEERDNVVVVTWEGEFNYAAINNFGVTHAKGDYILFLNNDTKVINETALIELLGCCMRKEVGVVGARLLYVDDTVQHAGIVIGFNDGYADYVFNGLHKSDFSYFARSRSNSNYSAVTAACMMVDRKVFDEVAGFSEEFKISANDIDFCLKVRQTGRLVVYNAFSLWYHYESKTRGYEDTQEKMERFKSEIALFKERWGEFIEEGDPYYNKNFRIDLTPYRLG
jgi:GT2 family glycosyltransferase